MPCPRSKDADGFLSHVNAVPEISPAGVTNSSLASNHKRCTGVFIYEMRRGDRSSAVNWIGLGLGRGSPFPVQMGLTKAVLILEKFLLLSDGNSAFR